MLHKKLLTFIPTLIVSTALISFIPSEAKALNLIGDCTTDNLSGSSDCAGTFQGNDANQNLNGLFGFNDWTQYAKVDGSSGTNRDLTVTSNDEQTSGDWSIDDISTHYEQFMIVLKGGDSFSSYYLIDSSVTNGTWNTQDLLKGNGQPGPALSHFTVYVSPQSAVNPSNTIPVAAVPEPLTIIGVGTALGLGAIFKRKLNVV